MTSHPLNTYTAAVASFACGPESAPPKAPPPPAEEETRTRAEAVLRRAAAAGHEHVILFGLGSGALAAALAPRCSLLVLEPEPARMRALAAAGRLPDCGVSIVADTSPWALLLLVHLHGPGRAAALVLNPELDPVRDKAARDAARTVQRLIQAAEPLALPADAPVPSLCAGAILAPDEPDLDTYFAQFPAWLRGVHAVWDAPKPPEGAHACAARLTHAAHPLDTGFADQRNRMLLALDGDWLLYLDGDEILTPETWALLPALCAADVEGWCLPRRTFLAPGLCRVGYGLWPDMQLRLFRNRPGLRFERPIHEILTGLDGPLGLLTDASILHYSHLRKDAETLSAKLARFDDAAEAGGAPIRHSLSREYPGVDCAVLDPAPGSRPAALRIPPGALREGRPAA